jgi:DNA mismatch repair protein MutL
MPIRVLDPTVAAQIAAGEVVERPASVAKELLENALDAGARRITVDVRGGGLRELTISDDGCGIPAADIETAFERHATSKLTTADDLWAIQTLGFRGEALPSIASVSQVTCTSRAADEEVGTELRVAGGELQARTAVGCPRGTTFVVRNLFYNVPVRREFLRSETTEASAIAAIVTQYAVAYPEVRFQLVIDGRMNLQTNGNGDLRATLVDIYGLDTARQLLEVQANNGAADDQIAVSGLVSPPGVTRSTRGAMHLFVNRRAIQPRGQLVFVIEEAYHTLLMKGRHPILVLNLNVHPSMVDVNIHPTKSEVKFRNAPRMHSLLGRAIRSALLEGGVQPWNNPPPLATETAQRRFELRRLGNDPPSPRGWEPAWTANDVAAVDQHPLADSWANEAEAAPWERSLGGEPQAEQTNLPTIAPPRSGLPPLRVVGQIAGTYIVAEAPDGMYLIDQHAAHERINYERLMKSRGQGPVERQELLVPQTVALTPEARQMLLNQGETLETWGFVVEDFGALLRIRAIPHGMRESEAATAIAEIAERLAGRGGVTPLDQREALLTTLSCHSSIRAGQSLSLIEMRELLNQLERCEVPRTCPHGRPTMLLLTTTQLERQFGRIK